MGRINEAIDNYEISLQLDDPSSYVYIRIAHCHEEFGNDQLALQFFKKGINEDPSNEKAWIGIIDFYIHKENLNKALYYCHKALQINENYVSYWKRSALINYALQHYVEAEIAFQNAIELGNYEAEMWNHWMETLLFLNEWEKGAKIGQQAKEFYPDDIHLDCQLVVCFYQLAKTIEMDYYLQNIRKSKESINEKLLKAFPFLSDLL